MIKLLLFFAIAHAAPSITSPKMWYSPGDATNSFYSDKIQCDALGTPCLDATQCPPDECDAVGGVMTVNKTKQSAKLAGQSDDLSKQSKLITLRQGLKTCVKSWATLTNAQQLQCVLAVVKIMANDQLQGSDL